MYSVASVEAASAGRAMPNVMPPAPSVFASAVQVVKLRPVVGSSYDPGTIAALHVAETKQR